MKHAFRKFAAALLALVVLAGQVGGGALAARGAGFEDEETVTVTGTVFRVDSSYFRENTSYHRFEVFAISDNDGFVSNWQDFYRDFPETYFLAAPELLGPGSSFDKLIGLYYFGQRVAITGRVMEGPDSVFLRDLFGELVPVPILLVDSITPLASAAPLPQPSFPLPTLPPAPAFMQSAPFFQGDAFNPALHEVLRAHIEQYGIADTEHWDMRSPVTGVLFAGLVDFSGDGNPALFMVHGVGMPMGGKDEEGRRGGIIQRVFYTPNRTTPAEWVFEGYWYDDDDAHDDDFTSSRNLATLISITTDRNGRNYWTEARREYRGDDIVFLTILKNERNERIAIVIDFSEGINHVAPDYGPQDLAGYSLCIPERLT